MPSQEVSYSPGGDLRREVAEFHRPAVPTEVLEDESPPLVLQHIEYLPFERSWTPLPTFVTCFV